MGGTIAAIAGIVGALGSLGTGIYGATQAGKNSTGGGGGMLGNLSPLNTPIADLFGQQLIYSGKEQTPTYLPVGNGLTMFSFPEPGQSQMQNQIAQYIWGQTKNPLESTIPLDLGTQAGALAQQGARVAQDPTQGILAGLLPTAQSLAKTGLPTDIGPIQQAAMRNFALYGLPQLAEQFAGQTGTFSTDFLGAGQRTLGDIFTNLGAQQVALSEAAKQRQISGLQLYPQLLAANFGIPMTASSDLAALGSSLFGLGAQQEAQAAGPRMLDVLGLGANLANSMRFAQTGFNPAASGSAQNLAALSSGIGGLGKALSNLGNLDWGGGGGIPSSASSNYGGINLGGSLAGANALTTDYWGSSGGGNLFQGLGGFGGSSNLSIPSDLPAGGLSLGSAVA